jgi:hypothetical protein
VKSELRNYLNEFKRHFYLAEAEIRNKKELERTRKMFLHQVQEHNMRSVKEAHFSYWH